MVRWIARDTRCTPPSRTMEWALIVGDEVVRIPYSDADALVRDCLARIGTWRCVLNSSISFSPPLFHLVCFLSSYLPDGNAIPVRLDLRVSCTLDMSLCLATHFFLFPALAARSRRYMGKDVME